MTRETPHIFLPFAAGPAPGQDKAWWFIISGDRILVDDTDKIPCAPSTIPGDAACYIGTLGGRACYCADLGSPPAPDGYRLVSLRKVYAFSDDDMRRALAYARQIHDLNLNFRFCGRCGSPTRLKRREHARICPDCGLLQYPRISPAVIMSVEKGDRILLARGVRFPDKKMFSVLAGFVSPGETLEECVCREVLEETGIHVKNVRYVASQPWPFPDSLMIGFTSQYESGDIRIEPEEIVEADWFHPDRLPKIPAEFSLAGRLIREFCSRVDSTRGVCA